MSCLQLCHVPRGSASPGTKMFLTCSKHVYMMATQKRLMTIAEYEHIYSNEVLSVITCHESYAALRMNRGVCICFTSFWGKKHCIEATCIREICYLGHRCIMVLLEIYILPVLEVRLKCTKKVNSSLNPKPFENKRNQVRTDNIITGEQHILINEYLSSLFNQLNSGIMA